MNALSEMMVKLGERNINVLSVQTLYKWTSGSSEHIGYIINFEYQYTGYMDRKAPDKVSTGWRKIAYEWYDPELAAPCLLESLKEIYRIVVETQDTIATPFKDR